MNHPIASLKEIPSSALSFRWADAYYDGILAGFASHQGQLCYFEIADDSAQPWRYILRSLSQEEQKEAAVDHEAFKQRFGDHCDLLPDGSSSGGRCHASVETALAQLEGQKTQPAVSYRDNPPLGWFSWPK